MIRLSRLGMALAALAAGTVVLPVRSYATDQLACSANPTRTICGVKVTVGDPDNPCIKRDEKAYCPVQYSYYQNAATI